MRRVNCLYLQVRRETKPEKFLQLCYLQWWLYLRAFCFVCVAGGGEQEVKSHNHVSSPISEMTNHVFVSKQWCPHQKAPTCSTIFCWIRLKNFGTIIYFVLSIIPAARLRHCRMLFCYSFFSIAALLWQMHLKWETLKVLNHFLLISQHYGLPQIISLKIISSAKEDLVLFTRYGHSVVPYPSILCSELFQLITKNVFHFKISYKPFNLHRDPFPMVKK